MRYILLIQKIFIVDALIVLMRIIIIKVDNNIFLMVLLS